VATIKNIRQLKGATVLAERTKKSEELSFARFNLVYGFNGSGKSTLSRVFSTLQKGVRHKHLPDSCTFEIEMTDGKVYACPDQLTGIEKRVCVFNADFVEEHLRWHEGTANPVFTLSAEQGDAVEKLTKLETEKPSTFQKIGAAEKVEAVSQKAFVAYKRERARSISELLRQTGRKYEAGQLADDYKKLAYEENSVLAQEALDAAKATCARIDAPQKLDPVALPVTSAVASIKAAAEMGPKTIGSIAVEGLDAHPTMVRWVKAGHDYHVSNNLSCCLHCGEKISELRVKQLSEAFDDKVTTFIGSLNVEAGNAEKTLEALQLAVTSLPPRERLALQFRAPFTEAEAKLKAKVQDVTSLLTQAAKVLQARASSPTSPINSELPDDASIDACGAQLTLALNDLNAVCDEHNNASDAFNTHQEAARLAIRKHFLAEGAEAYALFEKEQAEAEAEVKQARDVFDKLEADIAALKAKVQQHAPSAAKINELVKAYLGHAELTIASVDKGYELHRHGKLAKGAPSEGEKTAIALCYFLTTLEADARKPKDLIVIVDDPISSLDTKAMHYACAIVLGRLNGVAQLFVLTHNQQCMNEIKKSWKGLARKEPPEARLFFIDVRLPTGEAKRQASLIEMPTLLRELDSEYQFAVQKVLQFEAAGDGHFDHVLMMPNMLRRVLEIFLAFRLPRAGNIKDKLKDIGEAHQKLDKVRLAALERLVQVESHSDSLDDLTGHSSMTIEETRDANAALLELMKEVDPDHLAALRKYCKPEKVAA
jgi:wobble nucleotide-excising tRNase